MTCLARIEGLTKSYGGVRALTDVSLELPHGEIHAVCGENGAGKSTLIKCLTGVVRPDVGQVELDGRPLHFGDVLESESAGIAVIHQESTAFPDLHALDNIFVGREPRRWFGIAIDRPRMLQEARDVLRRLGQSIDMERPLISMSVAGRQMVALARALIHECRLLIMDEPTASLSAKETEVLMGIVRRLRDDGVTVLYVSHRLEELFQLADRVSVLRDGRLVGTHDIQRITKPDLIRMMVGRTTQREHDGENGTHVKPCYGPDKNERSNRQEKARLDVRGLTSTNKFQDINLQVGTGEIVGLAGLVGAGRTEVARAIFGIDTYDSGEVYVDGRQLPRGNVQTSVSAGLGLVPEDRQHEGLVLPMSVRMNTTMGILRTHLSRWGFIQSGSERGLVADILSRLAVKAANQDVSAESLSGGNQQKVVLGKWLASEPKILILDEPTRGVDVGAKEQVHQLIHELAAGGMATLVISSELPELLSLCDRILVMCQGRLSGELSGRNVTQQRVLELALPDEEG